MNERRYLGLFIVALLLILSIPSISDQIWANAVADDATGMDRAAAEILPLFLSTITVAFICLILYFITMEIR